MIIATLTMLSGCVSTGTHDETLAKLAETQKRLATAEEQASARQKQSAETIAGLERDKTTAITNAVDAQSAAARLQSDLDQTQRALNREKEARRELSDQLIAAQEDNRQHTRLSGEVRRERDLLLAKTTDQERKLDDSERQMGTLREQIAATEKRLQATTTEKDRLLAALDQATNQVRNLHTKLDAEQAQVASLQEDKQRLLSGTTTAQDEIEKLQKRAGELETDAARAKDLERQVAEKTQLIGELRQAGSDRDQMAAQASAQGEELRSAKQRIAELETELTAQREVGAAVKTERDKLTEQVAILAQENAARTADIKQLTLGKEDLAKSLQQERADRERELNNLMEKQMALGRTLGAEEATRASLQKERSLLETELKRMATTQEELAKTIDQQRAEQAKLDEKRRAQEREIAELTKVKQELLGSLNEQKEARANLLREKAEKDEEIKKLTQTYEDLTSSLRAEITKGDIKIQQVRDRLTINMVDRILFDSGSTKVKQAGLKVLKQVGDILKKVTDKQVRIEGHTDNVPIGTGLRERYPTNWELSTGRATSVVRYLIDEGGLAPDLLAAVGYGETRPIANNDTEEGRTSNRRIEIVLYPKDFVETTMGP
ncbi:OmpA family protein [Petrachloros mirabilis]